MSCHTRHANRVNLFSICGFIPFDTAIKESLGMEPSLTTLKPSQSQHNESFSSFVSLRAEIEQRYSQDLFNLAIRSTGTLQHTLPFDQLLEITKEQAQNHAIFAKKLSSFAVRFSNRIHAHDLEIEKLLGGASTLNEGTLDGLRDNVERSKTNYQRKCKEGGRTYDDLTEMQGFSKVYRDDVVELERFRCTRESYRMKSWREFEGFGGEMGRMTKGTRVVDVEIFIDLANSLPPSPKNQVFVKAISEMKSIPNNPDLFRAWPLLPRTNFIDYTTNTELKSLIFGVPLGFTTSEIPSILPRFLFDAFAEIEKRGIDKEGIYRVSGKTSEKDRVRIAIEANPDFDLGTVEVHTIASLVKCFFRELPSPLFPYPVVDRLTYSECDEFARLDTLRTRLALLPRLNLSVLKSLADHLCRIAKGESMNKMGIDNLALLFTTLLFEKPGEVVKDGGYFGFGIFKRKERSVQNSTTDLTNFEHLKTDLVPPQLT